MKNRITNVPARKLPVRKFIIPVSAGILGIIIGSATAGGGNDPAPTPAPVAAPITKTVTVEKTPQSCLTALSAADRGFDLASKAMGFASDGMIAVSNFDVDAVQTATTNLTATNEKITNLAPEYQSAREECRASAH